MLFVVQNGMVLGLLLACAAGAGTLATGTRDGLAMRTALGLGLLAQACFLLGVVGLLRPVPLLALFALALSGLARAPWPRIERRTWLAVLAFLPLFALALHPPLAFDETLYHLPFVQAFARDGAIRVLPDLRFPAFPVLHEALCVPAFLLAGESGAHLVSLAETIVLAALLAAWGGRRAGWLGAALLLGSPLVIHLATVLYVEIALALFVAAGFSALERKRDAPAAFFFGTACSVKYLGFYFALAALAIVLVRRGRWVWFAAVGALAALPMTLWICSQTGDPLFPFFGTSAWRLPPEPAVAWSERAMRIVRLPFDVTFARERVGFQPPVTPFLVLLLLLLLRDRSGRRLVLVAAPFLVVFTFLPQDVRYLAPLLPLVCLGAARAIVARWPSAAMPLAIVALAPGLAYAGYRLVLLGVSPSTAAQRGAWLERHVPEYRALERAGAGRTYNCGAERLKAYAAGPYLGDLNGPFAYERILPGANTTETLAARLRTIDVHWFLLAKRACTAPAMNGGMELVYEDAHAQLWRVLPATRAPSSARAAASRPLPPA